MTVGFWLSDAVLIATQGALVALPRGHAVPWLERLATRLHSRWWALVPVASIVGVIAAIRAAEGTADGLAWLALIAVPPLAAAALALAMHGARPSLGLLAAPLFALAWADRTGLAGEAAATALTALSCVTLGVLLAAVAPRAWLKAGIVLMACADVYLVATDLLQAPNGVLNAAAPPIGLPQLQRVLFGDALMGYGDLFVAALLGAVLALERSPAHQRRVARLTLALAILFDLLFVVVDELPATVPVAAALLLSEAARRRRIGART